MKGLIMKYLILFLGVIFTISCSNKQHAYSDEQVDHFKKQFANYVDEKNDYLKSDDKSPLLESDKPDFTGLHYYKYNPNFRFEGPIHIYQNPDTVIIYGSKNDERPSLKFGYVEFLFDEEKYQLQIFEILRDKPEQDKYLFLGFTDETSNDETYGGGRYINLEMNEENYYIIDFNYAYNPYCAYNPKYSCAIPTRENHLEIAVDAGEKKYHD
jgi:uncharacterized protein (DUF1684 family)